MDSSNSFTEYHETKVKAQKQLSTDNKKATPVYLYPETWLDMDDDDVHSMNINNVSNLLEFL